MKHERYIWFDRQSPDCERDLFTTQMVLLRNGYDCVVKDEGCGLVLYYVFQDPEMEESIEIINTFESFVVTEEDYEGHYNNGYDDAMIKCFEELKTMADDDLYVAMKNACDYKGE